MPQVSHLGEAPGRKPGTHLVSSSRPKRQRTVIEVTDSTSHWQYKWTCNRSLESSSPRFRIMLRKPIKFLRRNDLQARSTIT